MKTLADTLAVLAFGILLCGCRTVDSATQAECLIDFTYCQGARLNGLSLLGRNLGTNVHGILTKPHETNEKPGKWKREDFPAIERCMVRGVTGNGLDMDVWCLSLRACAIGYNRGDGFIVEQVIIHDNVVQVKSVPASKTL